MKKSIQSHSLKITKLVAKELAKTILKNPKREKAFVFALKGELGTGKTSFVQGLAKGLGITENILSPTFLILKKYQIPKSQFQNFYHIDCYRIENKKELLQLEWKDIIKDPQNIIAIEWADKIKAIIPKNALWISFSHKGEKKREIHFKG